MVGFHSSDGAGDSAERAAVNEGVSLMDKLIASLTDVPTPAGATTRETRAKVGRELPVLRHN
jgi:hypothetical protein